MSLSFEPMPKFRSLPGAMQKTLDHLFVALLRLFLGPAAEPGVSPAVKG